MRINRLVSVARQVTGAMRTHQNDIERGIDKAADVANQKTGSKHEQRIQTGTGHLRTALSKVTGNPGGTTRSGDNPPPPGPVIDHDRPDTDSHGGGRSGPEEPRG